MQPERPALILLDLQLPGVHDFALARQLTAEPTTRSIPVPAMSAYAQLEEQAQAVAAGCAGFLAKLLGTRAVLVTFARRLGR